MDTREQLDAWRKEVLAGWEDSRIVDAEWLDVQIWFWMHSYSDLANLGLELVGVNLRQKHDDWLMVLKLRSEGTQQVAFVSSSTPTRCMRKARKLMRNGGLLLYEDKYA